MIKTIYFIIYFNINFICNSKINLLIIHVHLSKNFQDLKNFDNLIDSLNEIYFFIVENRIIFDK